MSLCGCLKRQNVITLGIVSHSNHQTAGVSLLNNPLIFLSKLVYMALNQRGSENCPFHDHLEKRMSLVLSPNEVKMVGFQIPQRPLLRIRVMLISTFS